MPLWKLVDSLCKAIYLTSDVAPAVIRATTSSREGKIDINLESKDRQKLVKTSWNP